MNLPQSVVIYAKCSFRLPLKNVIIHKKCNLKSKILALFLTHMVQMFPFSSVLRTNDRPEP